LKSGLDGVEITLGGRRVIHPLSVVDTAIEANIGVSLDGGPKGLPKLGHAKVRQRHGTLEHRIM
jgi:hypothetical protein